MSPMGAIYLDSHATTPLLPEAREAMLPYLGARFGNPGSVHALGREAARGVARARGQVQALIGAERPSEVVFTGSGTEACNLALVGAALRRPGLCLVAGAAEHDGVLDPLKALAEGGHPLKLVAPGPEGVLSADAVISALGPGPALVSVGLANFEVGTLAPVAALGAALRARGVLFHCDASWAPGWIDLDVDALNVDLMTLSAHRFGGPKGVGVLYIRKGVALSPLIRGGYQERGRRPGTENTAAIVGMGAAADVAGARGDGARARVGDLRARLWAGILALDPRALINGAGAPGVPGLPGCLNVSFPGLEGESLLLSLDLEGVQVSSGAACTSGTLEPSHVLEAMGLGGDRARSSVRFTLGFELTQDAIDRALERIETVVRRLRALT